MAAFGKVKVTLTPLREACSESQLPMCFNCTIETMIIIPSLEGEALDLEAKFDDITALIAIKTKQNKRRKRVRPTFLLIKSNRRRLCLALWPMCKLEFDQLIKIYERGGERMLAKKGSFQIWIAEKWHQSWRAETIVTHGNGHCKAVIIHITIGITWFLSVIRNWHYNSDKNMSLS